MGKNTEGLRICVGGGRWREVEGGGGGGVEVFERTNKLAAMRGNLARRSEKEGRSSRKSRELIKGRN